MFADIGRDTIQFYVPVYNMVVQSIERGHFHFGTSVICLLNTSTIIPEYGFIARVFDSLTSRYDMRFHSQVVMHFLK